MREARVILPLFHRDGGPIPDVHEYFKRTLASTFGGFTSTTGQGGWVKADTGELFAEPVNVYDVAMVNTPENAETLRSLALKAGSLAGQYAMYIRLPSGEVVIPDVPATAVPLAA